MCNIILLKILTRIMRLASLQTSDHNVLILNYPNTAVATSWLGFKSLDFVPALLRYVRSVLLRQLKHKLLVLQTILGCGFSFGRLFTIY